MFNEKYNFALRTNTDTSGSLIDSKGDIIENNITINRETKEKSSIQLPLNSVLWCSKEDRSLYASLIIYPWGFLNVLKNFSTENYGKPEFHRKPP